MSDDECWMAEAAMLRILRRTLPAQRHEVLGALSALKLQLAVGRRRLSRVTPPPGPPAPDDDAAARLLQLEAMAEQQLAAQEALTEMRLWDGLSVQRRPLDAVIDQCTAWTRQAAAMRGHQLLDAEAQHDQAPEPAPEQAREACTDTPAPMVQVPAAHHMVLALVYEALDRLAAPQQLRLRMHTHGRMSRISLEASERSDAGGLPALPLAADASQRTPVPAGQAVPHIDAGMLRAMASHLSGADGSWRWLGLSGQPSRPLSVLEFELPS